MPQRCLPVDDLVTGLYVCELDRPWTETPFLFQGFLIDTQADIAALRAHCREVWVDEERSRVLPPRGESTGPAATTGRMLEDESVSASRPLGDGMRQARDSRQFARQCLSRAFAHWRREGGGDLPPALSEAAGRLDGIAAAHPEVCHWLANLQAHDQRLVDHSVNVALRSLLFAHSLELPAQQTVAVGLGGLLHDVGKLSLPVSLLDKPGPLSREEWGQIRRHPVLGGRLLSGSELPEPVMRIIRYHHERIDGGGFPEGLKGDELDLPVRLVALVNAFDSMTQSFRCDRPQLSGYQAVSTLMRDADSTWGRELVEAFVRLVGIYPAGTRVRLSNGAEGVVVYTPSGHRLHPVVCLYRRPDGSSETRLPMLNLSLTDSRGQRHNVERVIEPDGGEQALYQVITDEAFAA